MQIATNAGHTAPKKNILKSNSFDVMQTVFFAFTCKFGLVLHVEKVVICINKANWHPLVNTVQYSLGHLLTYDSKVLTAHVWALAASTSTPVCD